jgi:AcrR family transcriptional regulator
VSSESVPRRPVKEQLRDVRARYILEAAQDLLVEKGYRDASMDEIAARVGIAKGTLYQHFPRKEDLVLALLEQHVERFTHTVDAAAASLLPARARLEQVLRYVYDDRDGAYTMMQLLSRNVEIWKSLGPRKTQAMGRMDRTMAQVGRILEEGKADGSFDPGVPTPLMLRAFLNALTLGRPEPGSGLEALSPAEIAAQVGRVLFAGIAGGLAPGG